MIKLNSKVKFESLITPGRWFSGRVYGIVHGWTKTYALVECRHGDIRKHRSFVELNRLVEDK